MGVGARDFRQRAKVEADRYGADPWIFVRELVQNGRDAGATRIEFLVRTTELENGAAGIELLCRDNGQGMDFDHAKRFLFSLYTSSKEDDDRQVGRFGVGFWSILRFEPEEIVVRSRRANDRHGWMVRLRGDLESATYDAAAIQPGTEVSLRRTGLTIEETVRRIRDAAYQNARLVRCRDAADVAMKVVVNGELINKPFGLPAPSASFRRRGVRGVVGLGNSPRVELFARGLRVRASASLDDLLPGGKHSTRSRVRFTDLPSGLAPQALLESDELELLLSRSDARDDKSLRRLVRLAHRELERLVERQLASVRPPTIGERVRGLLRRLWGPSIAWRATLSALAGAAVALIGAQIIWPSTGSRDPAADVERSKPPVRPAGYADLAARYNGPEVSELDPNLDAEPLELTYTPADERPYFTALVVEADATGSAWPFLDSAHSGPLYVGPACGADCLDITLPVVAPAGPLRVPVPVGHRLDPESLMLGGQPIPVYASLHDEPVLLFGDAIDAELTYRTGPAASAAAGSMEVHSSLPDDMRDKAQALRREPVDVRVQALMELTREHVRYETSDQVGAQHLAARSAGQDFITRTLVIGAGDCDVQNGLLVQLLRGAGLEARLAVGYTGRAGAVSPWLHAWAEYRKPGEAWAVADASATEAIAVARPGTPVRPSAAAPGNPPNPGAQAEAEPSEPARPGAPETADGPDAPRPEATGIDEQQRARLSYLALGIVALGLVGLGLVLVAGRTRRQVHLDRSGDLSGLLQGALQKPAAFAHLPFLFTRRLVPLIGGKAISLERAKVLAGQGALYRGRGGAALTLDAVKRGAKVLDETTPEGRVVADTLGASNLDRWTELLAAPVASPILERLNHYLRSQGRRWEVRAVDTLPESVASLDLKALGIARTYERVIVVDRRNPWLIECERQAHRQPEAALFALLDHVCERAGVAHRERAQLLVEQADRALQESVA